ncbi:MAG: hypothetical protein M1818_006064 [Claussenomyces sp. TS43310]|nr:MAG: hypothetical protein M1818_006064 [Claussenomyces sp. TS43310]
MAPVYRIAVIQLHIEPMQHESNFTKACSFIRSAASEGCNLAVLPEYHLDGWKPDDPNFRTQRADYKKYLSAYCSLAKELKICIVPGTALEKDGEDLANVAHFISSNGEVLSSYKKKNLWHPERPHLVSSGHTAHEAFDTPIGKVGMLICWDLAFPEAFRELIAGGAQIIIIPTFWTHADCSPEGLVYNSRAETLFLESTLISRTFENTCAVVFANAGGPVGRTNPGTYCGLSQVAVPFIGSLGKMGEEEGMSVVDLDMQILEEAEKNYKVREDMGREGWHYDYTLDRGGNKSNL